MSAERITEIHHPLDDIPHDILAEIGKIIELIIIGDRPRFICEAGTGPDTLLPFPRDSGGRVEIS